MKNVLAMFAEWLKNSVCSPWFLVFALFLLLDVVAGSSIFLPGGVLVMLLWKIRPLLALIALMCALPS